MPTHLTKSRNRAQIENGTYEQIVTHLESEVVLNASETPDERQLNTVSHNVAKTNANKPKPMC